MSGPKFLRELAKDIRIGHMLTYGQADKTCKVADEIERLTAENQRLRDALQPFAERHIGVHEYFDAKAENPPRYIMVELVWLRAAYHALEGEVSDE